MVCLPFNIACGFLRELRAGVTPVSVNHESRQPPVLRMAMRQGHNRVAKPGFSERRRLISKSRSTRKGLKIMRRLRELADSSAVTGISDEMAVSAGRFPFPFTEPAPSGLLFAAYSAF